jgi:hypothetical protein
LNEWKGQQAKSNHQHRRDTPAQDYGLNAKPVLDRGLLYRSQRVRARFLHCLAAGNALMRVIDQQQRPGCGKLAVYVSRNQRLKVRAVLDALGSDRRRIELCIELAGGFRGHPRPNSLCSGINHGRIDLLVPNPGSCFIEDGVKIVIAFHVVLPSGTDFSLCRYFVNRLSTARLSSTPQFLFVVLRVRDAG